MTRKIKCNGKGESCLALVLYTSGAATRMIESLIEGSEKLIQIIGHWPSFHDAEILDLSLWRGDVDPERNKYVFPVLTLTVHLWEMTKEVDSAGYFVLRDHTLATMKFHNVDRLQMQGFNHQNAIFGLSVDRRERDESPSPYFAVELEPAFGVSASFTCLRVEVVTASRCGRDGEALSPDRP
jgi:hypothetical protein